MTGSGPDDPRDFAACYGAEAMELEQQFPLDNHRLERAFCFGCRSFEISVLNRQLRQSNGLSDSEIGRQCNKDQSTISRLFNGKYCSRKLIDTLFQLGVQRPSEAECRIRGHVEGVTFVRRHLIPDGSFQFNEEKFVTLYFLLRDGRWHNKAFYFHRAHGAHDQNAIQEAERSWECLAEEIIAEACDFLHDRLQLQPCLLNSRRSLNDLLKEWREPFLRYSMAYHPIWEY